MSSRFLAWALAAFVCLGSVRVCSQEAQAGPTAARSGLQLLAGAAGAVFTGTVTAVRRMPARNPNQVETVQITFRVGHALRGAKAGTDLTIREWSGLWMTGERYRVGERVLLFLYPPSKLGLTSPVAGPLGRFALDEQDRAAVSGGLMQEVMGSRGAQGRSTGSPGPRELSSGMRVSYRDIFRAVQRAAEE